MTDKFHHHIIPRFYLKGFASDKDPSLIWEYQRGRPYAPGPNSREKYNPVLITLRKAGATFGAYACPLPTGEIDFNTYEDALERLEKPADKVFDKIRDLQPISDSDRDILVAYMSMMVKRIPSRKEMINFIFPEIVEELWQAVTKEIENELSQIERMDEKAIRLQAGLEACRQIIDEYRQNGMPREMELKTMIDNPLPRIRDAVKSMKWQFFVAPSGSRFVTSDNPVHTFKGGVGLNKPYSELVFPISSRVALLCTYRNVPQRYIPASNQVLKEINRRIIATSTEFVYSSRDDKKLITVMKKQEHRFNFIYPAPEISSRIQV